jgi:hypothetical protein
LDGYATGTAGAGGNGNEIAVFNNNLKTKKLSKIDMSTPEKLCQEDH